MLNTSPWEGAVRRAMKVGKEEVIGFLTAIETWLKNDLNALNREWNARIEPISTNRQTVPAEMSVADDMSGRDRLYYSNGRELVPDTAHLLGSRKAGNRRHGQAKLELVCFNDSAD